MHPAVDEYCTDFISQRLGVPNCLRYLHQAVKYQLTDLQRHCTLLAARGARWHAAAAAAAR
jgi:hypothetical protein